MAMASLFASPDFLLSPRPNMSCIVDPLLVQASHLPPRSPLPSSSSASSRRSSTVARKEPEEEDSNPNTYEIAPPPEQEYPNPKVAEQEIHSWTKALCYEMSRTKGDKNKDGVIYKQYYKCAKHGKPSNTRKLTEETRARRGPETRRIGCPMGIVVKAVDPKAPGGPWKIHHQMNRKSFFHNHPPASDPSELRSHRRRARNDNVKSIAKKQKKARIPAHQSLAFFQDDVEACLYSERNINNNRVRDRPRELPTSTRIEALNAKMDALNYYHEAKIGENGHLEALFYSHPQSVKDLEGTFDFIMLDNTFKTNKYNVPVCNIIGVTGMNATIQFGLAFVPTQDEAAFIWVLQQIQNVLTHYTIEAPRVIVIERERACIDALNNVFPHIPSLICQWHTNKDVLSHCRENEPQIHDIEDYDITKAIHAIYFTAVNSTRVTI